MEAPFADEHAERVSGLVARAFGAVLGERLEAVAVHGSAVTGYIPGFSDFDFVVFLHGQLSLEDSVALQSWLGAADIAPFTYLQLSRVIDLDEPGERHMGLVDGAYSMAHGALPAMWGFHDTETLRESGREALRGARQRRRSRLEDWAVEGGPRRTNRLRLFLTDVKPAVRALLTELGEPTLEMWNSDYFELSRRLGRYDATLGARLDRILDGLPAAGDREERIGAEVVWLLDEIDAMAASLGALTTTGDNTGEARR
ncbi:MAG: hypothetical protein GEU80_15735 [Dehalococcoidia bacterium]|nr:hypothetical protein [Dehalococcoidia bacterium]